MNWATILPAIGLFALGISQAVNGNYSLAINSFLAGAAALGLHVGLQAFHGRVDLLEQNAFLTTFVAADTKKSQDD